MYEDFCATVLCLVRNFYFCRYFYFTFNIGHNFRSERFFVFFAVLRIFFFS